MSVMDRFLSAMKFNEDEEDDDFYDSGSEDDYTEKTSARRIASAGEHKSVSDSEDYAVSDNNDTSTVRKLAQKVTPIKQAPRRNNTGSGSADVLSIMPKTYEDSKIITDTLLENKAVILNLEGLDFDLAQRIIDFSSGSCYALGGNLQWISKYIIIIAPQNINISGDFQNLMDNNVDSSIPSQFGKDF